VVTAGLLFGIWTLLTPMSVVWTRYRVANPQRAAGSRVQAASLVGLAGKKMRIDLRAAHPLDLLGGPVLSFPRSE
jgi:hypothetical protein